MVYLDPEGDQNFNKMLVDTGHARVKDYTINEFDPDDWWAGEETPEATPTVAGKYVRSVKSDKYHYPDCRRAKNIKPENGVWFLPAPRRPGRRGTCRVGSASHRDKGDDTETFFLSVERLLPRAGD